jgi:hypothetical protein
MQLVLISVLVSDKNDIAIEGGITNIRERREECMDFDQNGFYRKLEKEISRLEKTADRLEGLDRDLVMDMIRALELECTRFRTTEEIISGAQEKEKEEARSTIITLLNQIEAQLQDLERTHGKEETRGTGSQEEASRIVGQFFVDCQVAEERIKQYGGRGMLTREQIGDLNNQLKGYVHRMIKLSKKSDLLIDAVLDSYEAMITGL